MNRFTETATRVKLNPFWVYGPPSVVTAGGLTTAVVLNSDVTVYVYVSVASLIVTLLYEILIQVIRLRREVSSRTLSTGAVEVRDVSRGPRSFREPGVFSFGNLYDGLFGHPRHAVGIEAAVVLSGALQAIEHFVECEQAHRKGARFSELSIPTGEGSYYEWLARGENDRGLEVLGDIQQRLSCVRDLLPQPGNASGIDSASKLYEHFGLQLQKHLVQTDMHEGESREMWEAYQSARVALKEDLFDYFVRSIEGLHKTRQNLTLGRKPHSPLSESKYAMLLLFFGILAIAVCDAVRNHRGLPWWHVLHVEFQNVGRDVADCATDLVRSGC